MHAGHVKRTQLDPSGDVRARARKDITAVKALTARHMKAFLSTDSMLPLSADDIAALRGLNYAAELRSLVTLGRLLYAWQIDPSIRPSLDLLLSNSRSNGPLPLPTPAAPVLPQAQVDAGGASVQAAANSNSPEGSTVGGGSVAAGTGGGGGNDAASNSGEAGPSGDVPTGSNATAETAEVGQRPYAHDPRKLMLAQLIADQVSERRACVATVRELANAVEVILSDNERHSTLNTRIQSIGAELAALQVCTFCVPYKCVVAPQN
jgi:hypothetical protein